MDSTTTPAIETVSESRTFQIPEINIDTLRTAIEKLARKAKKLGLPAPTMELGASYTKQIKKYNDYTGEIYTVLRLYYPVTVTGHAPKLPGDWRFAAVLTRVEDANLIASIVGDVPEMYRTCQPECDHCGYKRNRKDTFLVVNPEGGWKQVGRDCLVDFLGHKSPEALANMLELMPALFAAGSAGEEEEGGCGGPVAERVFSLVEYLSYVCANIRVNGWMGRRESREKGMDGAATADLAFTSMRPYPGTNKNLIVKPEDADRAQAMTALEWAEVLEVRSDFEHNMSTLAKAGYCESRFFGVAAYIPMAYARHLAEQTKALLPDGPSTHIGTVGARAIFTLTVEFAKPIQGQYGLTTLVAFRDASGNRAKWFCSGEAPEGFTPGTTVTVKATIKSHGEFRGTKETGLARVERYSPKAAKSSKTTTA